MEEGENSSLNGCTDAGNHPTASAGFIGPMTAVLVLDLLVIVGNSLVVTAVFTHGKLRRSTTNRFIVSLAVADLMVGLLVLPFSSANEVSYTTRLRKFLFYLLNSSEKDQPILII